jgi:hypothetical protein
VPKLASACDTFVYAGLYIEIKADPNDTLSLEQRWWMNKLMDQGYDYYVARLMDPTLEYIKAYLGG